MACRQSGLQMTPLREAAVSELWRAERPLTAYELLARLSEIAGRNLGPPTVYRLLDTLCQHGIARRIESLNAYVACHRREHDHECIFLLCQECGGATEIEDNGLERLLRKQAETAGFEMTRRVVEVSGVCAPCRTAVDSDGA